LQAAASLSVGNAISLGGSATIDTQSNGLTLTNAILGGGSLTKIGTGTLTLDNANAAYTGATTVAAGTLALLNGADMSNTSLMTVNGGAIFDISGHTGSAAINALAGGGTVQLGGNGLVILNASTEFSGAVAGSGGLEILSGTQTRPVTATPMPRRSDPGVTLALKETARSPVPPSLASRGPAPRSTSRRPTRAPPSPGCSALAGTASSAWGRRRSPSPTARRSQASSRTAALPAGPAAASSSRRRAWGRT
jgi:autotransporter-associated beta strand protein